MSGQGKPIKLFLRNTQQKQKLQVKDIQEDEILEEKLNESSNDSPKQKVPNIEEELELNEDKNNQKIVEDITNEEFNENIRDFLIDIFLQDNRSYPEERALQFAEEIRQECQISKKECVNNEIFLNKLNQKIVSQQNKEDNLNSHKFDSSNLENQEEQTIKQISNTLGQNLLDPNLQNQINNKQIHEVVEIQGVPPSFIYEHPQLKENPPSELGRYILKKINFSQISKKLNMTTIKSMFDGPFIPSMRKALGIPGNIFNKMFQGQINAFTTNPEVWLKEDSAITLWNKMMTFNENPNSKAAQVLLKPLDDWKEFVQQNTSKSQQEQSNTELLDGLQLLITALYDPKFSTGMQNGENILQKAIKDNFVVRNFIAAVLFQLSVRELWKFAKQKQQEFLRAPPKLNDPQLQLFCVATGEEFNCANSNAGLLLIKAFTGIMPMSNLYLLNKWGAKQHDWVVYRQLSRFEFKELNQNGKTSVELNSDKKTTTICNFSEQNQKRRHTTKKQNQYNKKFAFESPASSTPLKINVSPQSHTSDNSENREQKMTELLQLKDKYPNISIEELKKIVDS